MRRISILFQVFVLLFLLAIYGCAGKKISENEVVIYTAHDQVYSEPIIREFERLSGITVEAVFDTEATKTTGIVNRIIAESSNPQADVFWNNEISRTIVLKKKSLLAPYMSPSAADIPDMFKDREGYWTGFAARARVIVYNKDLLKEEDAPRSIYDFVKEGWKGKLGIANPLFGTTSTHAAALFVRLGDAPAKEFFARLKDVAVVVESNSVVRNQVGAGELWAGLTDTDDVNSGIMDGMSIGMIYPDQEDLGTLIIPNTVAMIANCRHPENAKKFIDYLLSKEVEGKLAYCRAAQMPLRAGVEIPDSVTPVTSLRAMEVNFEKVADQIKESSIYIRDVFLR